MDIHSAHKLDLLARNLQMAQTAIDSANEFMQELLTLLNEEREAPIINTSAVRKQMPKALLPPAEAPQKKTRTNHGGPNLSALLREFIALHKRDVITAPDYLAWLEEREIDLDPQRARNIMSLFSTASYGVLKRTGVGQFKWTGRPIDTLARDEVRMKAGKKKQPDRSAWTTPLVREYFETHSSNTTADDIVAWAKKEKNATLDRKKVVGSFAYLHKEKIIKSKDAGVWAKAA
jgi:hypothetical protein